MDFHPRFSYSHAMVRHLGLIESARAVVSVLPLPPDQELRLRQTARQRATRHSTRIEGNTLNTQVKWWRSDEAAEYEPSVAACVQQHL